jgi:protein transport protein SEC9
MSSSFLRRKERNAIPPVNDDRSSRAGSESGGAPIPARYTRGNDKGDVYSRGQRNLDNDRAELFGGYDPATQRGPNRFRDEVPGRSPNFNPDEPQADNEDDDVEAIKTQTRFVKQESVNSTRNALRIAREAEETARNTLLKLGDQSGTFSVTSRDIG